MSDRGDSHKTSPTTTTTTPTTTTVITATTTATKTTAKKPGWVKLLRDVPVVLSPSSLRKEETKPKVPWRNIDDELMLEETATAAPLSSSDSSSDSGNASRSLSTRSGTSASTSDSGSSSSGSGSGSSNSSDSNQSTISTHLSSVQSSGSEYGSMSSLKKESMEKDVYDRNQATKNDEGNDHSDDEDQSTESLTVMDAVPQTNKDRRTQAYNETANHHESSAGILDAGTIWGRVVGDTILSTSNESSLNYSDTSDITGFSMPYVTSATRPLHEENETEIHTPDGQEEDENDGNTEDESSPPRETQTPDTADALIGDEHSDSPNDALADSGETSLEEMSLRPMISTTTQPNEEPNSNAMIGTAPTRKTDPAEEGGFLAFLAQMRQLTEQPVDAALREFVPPDVAENARAADPYNADDDAVTVQVRNEDQERRIHPRSRRNAGMSSNDAARGGSMDWRFSIPPDAHNSNYPLLGDHNDKKIPDFREIPLSYSPSARMQPWGPNTDDLWTSTTRLLAAIPEEVASVISTASMSLSYIKIGQQPGSAGPDPKWIRERKTCLAIAVVATLLVTVVGLVFVVLAVTNSTTTSLVASGEPMSPPMMPTATSSGQTQAPTTSPVLRGSRMPSGQPSNSQPQPPIESQTPITSPSGFDVPSTLSLSPGPAPLAFGPGNSGNTESPSTAPSLKVRNPAFAPADLGPITESPSVLLLLDPTFLAASPSSAPSSANSDGLASGDGEPITESPSIAPSLDTSFFPSEAPTLEQDPTNPSNTPSMDSVQDFTAGPTSFNPFAPSLLDFLDKLQPSSVPSASSSMPSMNTVQDFTAGPTSFSPFEPSLLDFLDKLRPSSAPSVASSMPSMNTAQDFTASPMSFSPSPPSLMDVLDDLQPSNAPSVSSLLPTPEAYLKSTASPVQLPSFGTPSVSPDLGTAYGPIDTFQPTLMPNELTYQPTAMSLTVPSNSPTITPVWDVTSLPSEPPEQSQTTWELVGQIGSAGAYRSVKVSEDGSRAAIATSDQLQVFEHTDDGAWQQLGYTIPVQGIHAISISGDGNTVAQGTFFDGDENNHIVVYRWNGMAWVQVGSALPGACAFPGSLELSSDGSIVAIGNPFELYYSGYIEVFEFDETLGDWKRRGDIIQGENSGDMAGTSVSLSSDGSVVAFGSPGRTIGAEINIGQAAIFQYNPTFGWSQVGKSLLGYDPLKQFGYSLSLSGNGTRIAISAPFADPQGDLRCMVYVFEATMSSDDEIWHLVGDGIEGLFLADNSGTSVSLASDGQTLAIGAPRRRYVQILALKPEGWIQIGFIESNREQFGSSVSLASDGRVGAASGSNTYQDGIVQIFQQTEPFASTVLR